MHLQITGSVFTFAGFNLIAVSCFEVRLHAHFYGILSKFNLSHHSIIVNISCTWSICILVFESIQEPQKCNLVRKPISCTGNHQHLLVLNILKHLLDLYILTLMCRSPKIILKVSIYSLTISVIQDTVCSVECRSSFWLYL